MIEGQLPERRPAGAEARVDFAALAARLKSCPDTEPSQNPVELSFSAGCKAQCFNAGLSARLKACPFTERVRRLAEGRLKPVFIALGELRDRGDTAKAVPFYTARLPIGRDEVFPQLVKPAFLFSYLRQSGLKPRPTSRALVQGAVFFAAAWSKR